MLRSKLLLLLHPLAVRLMDFVCHFQIAMRLQAEQEEEKEEEEKKGQGQAKKKMSPTDRDDCQQHASACVCVSLGLCVCVSVSACLSVCLPQIALNDRKVFSLFVAANNLYRSFRNFYSNSLPLSPTLPLSLSISLSPCI